MNQHNNNKTCSMDCKGVSICRIVCKNQFSFTDSSSNQLPSKGVNMLRIIQELDAGTIRRIEEVSKMSDEDKKHVYVF